MTTEEYQTGDRVYYTGDSANLPGEGIIIKRREADSYAPTSYDLKLDEDRTFRGVTCLSFEPGPGRRFWLLSEWNEDREDRMQQFWEEVKAAKVAKVV